LLPTAQWPSSSQGSSPLLALLVLLILPIVAVIVAVVVLYRRHRLKSLGDSVFTESQAYASSASTPNGDDMKIGVSSSNIYNEIPMEFYNVNPPLQAPGPNSSGSNDSAISSRSESGGSIEYKVKKENFKPETHLASRSQTFV
jgi:hypothetical protein